MSTATLPHDPDVVRALNHPTRQRILDRLHGTRAALSPVLLARELDEPLGNVSYHVKILLETGCVKLARTANRRGAVEHFYRPTDKAPDGKMSWKDLGRLREPARTIIRNALEERDNRLCDGEVSMVERDEDSWLTDYLRVLG